MSETCSPGGDERERIESEVRAKYRRAASGVEGLFPYPVGRAGATALGYAAEELAAVPSSALERFVGVGRPFELRVPRAGERVLDVGCGAGTDVFVAARAVTLAGRVVGVDASPEMCAVARAAAAESGALNVRFEVASAEALPFADASFDQVIANGALNLVFDKPRAFAELARVLVPGGVLALADLVLEEQAPARLLAGADAWST